MGEQQIRQARVDTHREIQASYPEFQRRGQLKPDEGEFSRNQLCAGHEVVVLSRSFGFAVLKSTCYVFATEIPAAFYYPQMYFIFGEPERP